MLLSSPSVEEGRSIHGNVSELLISRREGLSFAGACRIEDGLGLLKSAL
jgi:hypothetical protein